MPSGREGLPIRDIIGIELLSLYPSITFSRSSIIVLESIEYSFIATNTKNLGVLRHKLKICNQMENVAPDPIVLEIQMFSIFLFQDEESDKLLLECGISNLLD